MKSVPDLSCRQVSVQVFTEQRKQLFLNLILLLLLLQICYSVLHSSARARCPTLSRSASVTMATAMDQTVEPIWLPKGNCSSQAVSACVASHMSDNVLAQSSVTFMSLGKPRFVLYMLTSCFLYMKNTQVHWSSLHYCNMPTCHIRNTHKTTSTNLAVKLELSCAKYSASGGLGGQLDQSTCHAVTCIVVILIISKQNTPKSLLQGDQVLNLFITEMM